MKRKILSVLLVLAMALTLLPTMAFAAEVQVSAPTVTGATQTSGKNEITATVGITAAGSLSVTNSFDSLTVALVNASDGSAVANVTPPTVTLADDKTSYDVTFALPDETVASASYKVTATVALKAGLPTSASDPDESPWYTLASGGKGESSAVSYSYTKTETDNRPTYTVKTVPTATIAQDVESDPVTKAAGDKLASMTVTLTGGEIETADTAPASGAPTTVWDLVTAKAQLTKDGTAVANVAAVNVTDGKAQISMTGLADGSYGAEITYTYKTTQETAAYKIGTGTLDKTTATAVAYTAPGGGTGEDKTPVPDPTNVNIANDSTATSKKVTWTYAAENLAKISGFSVQLVKITTVAEGDPATTPVNDPVTVNVVDNQTAYEYTYAVPSTLAAGTYAFMVTAVAKNTAANTNSGSVTTTGSFTVNGGGDPDTTPATLTGVTATPALSTTNKTTTVSWTYTPAVPATATAFLVKVQRIEGSAVPGDQEGIAATEVTVPMASFETGVAARAGSVTNPTKNGNTYTVTYTVPEALAEGTYRIHVCDGVVAAASANFTVKSNATENTVTEKVPDSSEIADMNRTEASTVIEDVKGTTSGLTSTAKDDFAEAVLGNTELTDKIAALEEKAGVDTRTTGSTTAISTITSVVGLGMTANGYGRPTLTLGNAAKVTSTTSAAAFSLTVSGGGITNSAALDYPVTVTLPIPTTLSSFTHFAVYHYAANGTKSEIPSTVAAGKITFVTWSFSDFAIVGSASAEIPTPPDANGGSTGGNKTPSKGGSSTGGGKVVVSTPTDTTTTTTTNASGFTDVPDSHTFANEIKWAKDNGYMNGTGNGAFSPSNTVNRQQLWMVLARIAGANPADMAAAKAWAVENSISDGTNPTGALSRQQLVTMMFRFAALTGKTTEGAADLSTYPDAADVSGYAQEALAWAVQNGIVNGTSTGALNPWGGATRGAFAAILYRYSNNTAETPAASDANA